DFAVHLRNFRFAAGYQPRVHAVATGDQRIFRSVEDSAAAAVVQRFACRYACRTRRGQTAVVPGYFHFGHVDFLFFRTGRENVFHHLGVRGAIGQQGRRTALYAVGITQLQTFEYRVQDVAGHVAEGSGAEVPPTAPVPRGIDFVVRTHL